MATPEHLIAHQVLHRLEAALLADVRDAFHTDDRPREGFLLRRILASITEAQEALPGAALGPDAGLVLTSETVKTTETEQLEGARRMIGNELRRRTRAGKEGTDAPV